MISSGSRLEVCKQTHNKEEPMNNEKAKNAKQGDEKLRILKPRIVQLVWIILKSS
jgi:hypothetical protein